MKNTILAAVISGMASPALACIPLSTYDGLSILVDRGGIIARFNYADLRTGSRTLKSEDLRASIQAQMDDRQERLGLVFEDPDRSVNPDRATIYWSDADGNPVSPIGEATHVTSRCVELSVEWDGFDHIVAWQRVK